MHLIFKVLFPFLLCFHPSKEKESNSKWVDERSNAKDKLEKVSY